MATDRSPPDAVPVEALDPLEAELLAVVVARPDDDLPRLVYADYLAERGDPRAELIRVQIELTRRTVARSADDQALEPTAASLRAREAALLDRCEESFVPPNGLTFGKPCVRRGFLTGVEGSLSALEQLPPAWLGRWPLEELRADLRDESTTGWGAARILGRAAWRRVTVRGALYFQGVRPFADALAACPTVEELTLAGTALSVEGLADLLASPAAARLKSLAVRDVTIDGRCLDIFCAASESLPTSRSLPALRRLELRGSLTDADYARLAYWPGLGRLTRLDLGAVSAISVSTWQQLLASPYPGRGFRFQVDPLTERRLERAGLFDPDRFEVVRPDAEDVGRRTRGSSAVRGSGDDL